MYVDGDVTGFLLFLSLSEEAAETEPAWEGAGQEEGLKIWRIVVSGDSTGTPVWGHHARR